MARYFLTKVWGFDPEIYPALGFSTEGGRQKFISESEPGDWVLLAGTKGPPTAPHEQGRLLGRVQLGPEQIDVEKVLLSIGAEIPEEHYTEAGRYRWPYGFPIIAAERFPDLPDLAELFGDYLSGTQWATYALDINEKLGVAAVAKVAELRTEPATILEVPEIVRQRERQRALVLNRTDGPTGPGPSTSRSGSVRTPGAASAYSLELRGGQRQDGVFKIGYTADVTQRLAALNSGLVSSVTGYSWKLVLSQEFATEQQAYDFEQIMHRRLSQYRVDGEQEVYSISQNVLESVWVDVVHRAEWAVSKDR